MGNVTNNKRAVQLGMPFGTAANRLKKQILFSLLEKTKENFCFRCLKEIKDVSSLTIEHKKDWFNNDTALFWDLDNIAFSHSSCNLPYLSRNSKEGQLICSICKKWKELDSFRINQFTSSKKRQGRIYWCIICERSYSRNRYHKNEYNKRRQEKTLQDRLIGRTSLSESENSRFDS